MAIVTNKHGDTFLEFIKVEEDHIWEVTNDAPLTHSLLVIRKDNLFLLMFNKRREQWELPGGMLDQHETARQCAERELVEETNQSVPQLNFIGLLKFRLQPGERIEYGALFSGEHTTVAPFTATDEANQFMFWDTIKEIGQIDEIMKKLLEYY